MLLTRSSYFHQIKGSITRGLNSTNNGVSQTTLSPAGRFLGPQETMFTRQLMQDTGSRFNPKFKRTLGEKAGLYSASIAVAMFAASFAAVPLYKLYCQVTGKGGQAFKDEDNKIVGMKKDTSRLITVNFDANTHSSMAWNFTPLQNKVKVHPGETALAFYRAKNPLDEPVIGIATYSVLPYEASPHFTKIQCFCFEEQMLQPHEDVFMPVLFYIDPEYSKDPALGSTDDITLSYTFFRSKDGDIPDLDEPIELKKHK